MQFNYQTQLYSDFLIPYEQEVFKVVDNITPEESLEMASVLFFDSLNFELNINDNKALSQETKDRIAVLFLNRFFDREIGFETERKFKMKLTSILNANSDVYSKRISIMFNTFLKENVDMKKEYERLNNLSQNSNSKGSSTGNAEVNENGSSKTNVSRNTDDNTEQTDNNFNRNILENTPDERLNLTSNAEDGSGVINKASQITENKVTNKQSGKNTQTLNGEEDNLSTNKNESQFESSDENESILNGESKDVYNDRNYGYDYRNFSQGKVYKDYLESLENVFEDILDDCDKCFMQIWV